MDVLWVLFIWRTLFAFLKALRTMEIFIRLLKN